MSGDKVLQEIEVTPEMIQTGLVELRDHSFGGDLGYMVESVYRAMEYAHRDSKSSGL